MVHQVLDINERGKKCYRLVQQYYITIVRQYCIKTLMREMHITVGRFPRFPSVFVLFDTEIYNNYGLFGKEALRN